MKTVRVALLGVFLFCTIGIASPTHEKAKEVELKELIANPHQFEGKRIRVKGYIRHEFEGDSIFVSAEDRKVWRGQNGLILEWPRTHQSVEKDFFGIVEGSFHSDYKGHLDNSVGGLKEITQIKKIK